MNAVGRLGSYISRGVYTVSGPFHPFGGCVDVIVVEQPDGTFKSSPWYVRFGKFQGVLKTREKVVNICVNGLEADLHMYLDHKGEAYFLREVDEVEEGESVMMNNSSSGDDESERPFRSQSCNFDDDGNGGKVVVARTNSRRAQFLGLVFGRRSRQESNFRVETDMRRADSLERAEFAANLMEVKWSTNIDTTKPIVEDNALELFHDSRDRDMRMDGSLDEPSLATLVMESPLSVNNGDEYTVLHNEHECSSDGALSGIFPAVLQICPRKESDDEALDTRGIEHVSECSVSGELETDKVQSFIYCESSESSIVRKDASSEQTHETMYISSGESGELRVHSEVLRATTEPLSVDTVVEHLIGDYELAVAPVVGLDDCLEKTGCSFSGTGINNRVVADERLGKLETCTQTNGTNPVLGFADEVESQDIYTISSFNNSSFLSEDEENTAKKYVPTEETSIPPSEDLEEEQFLFGEIDEFNGGDIQSMEMESSFPINEGIDTSDRSESPPENFSCEYQSPDLETSTGNFRISSSPIAITGAQNVVVDEDIGRLTESLPNLWSKIDSLGADDDDDVNCLSHSLDSNSKVLNWTLQTKESPRSIVTLDGDKERQLVPELSDMKDAVETNEVENLPSTSVIEISLCKHLLSEGMGSDAASRVFDSEKLDLEKFSALGPEVMKDNRLVVRINGSYYPWDEAAPMVLGAVSFGTAHIVEPKGKIAIDQVEQTVSGDLSSNASMSPGGNWRLWPFSFRRSRSRKLVQPALSDARNSDAETASEINVGISEDKNTVKPKVVKKTVRALCPTSEQLASLNLKSGRNTVTFTFLTPMLGKQQVDARIYVWKWNTRIVISDVDGTITRSDVLGQFMPLVGVDWSHIGVAHLFSAIKENGYQMLFLSARAISQAYITRQFLFNLKQDGKALPDGPVVISPDGLFPSLYREVIRRAPHEFKIACLEEIRSLFPSDCSPFYAGFGNRDTDEVSYLKVGIPKGKIFIINPKGEVAVNRRVDTKSYKSIHALVNGMFPPTASSEQEDFNSWNFWKLPPPDIDE